MVGIYSAGARCFGAPSRTGFAKEGEDQFMAQRNNDLNDILRQMFGIPNFADDGDGGEAIPVEAEVDGGSGPTGAGNSSGSGARPPRRPEPPARSWAEVIAQWSRRAFILLAIVAAVALAVGYWWFHPALNLRSPQVWSWILLICVAAICALQVAAVRSAKHKGFFRKLVAVPGAVIAFFFLGVLMGQSFIPGNAERFATVLDTTDGDFSKDIHEVDYSEVPVIDRDSAALLGNRAMGSIPEYVSQFEVADTYSQINYQGRPVRVSPLVYADLFKWWSNREAGIPAYVLVDMVTQEAKVVRLKQGIKYSESEPLARNIDRYAQLKYPNYMFDQKSFELDEDGNPWWVFPVQARTIGLFEGTTIQRVVLVNACTGETEDYAIDDCPEWVDRAYPSDLIIQQYNWSGAYKNGWLNSWLGQQGVVRTTEGTDGNLGYNYLAQGEDIYLYSGVTSATADNSIVGFILVNQRTGESHYYSVAGATEDSAMESAEGAVQNLGYTATYPLLLNVAGQPTYFMALKDRAGLVKMFAMINVDDYQSVAKGDSVEATQENYLQLLANGGKLSDEEAAAAGAEEQASGKVASIAQAVIDGNSHFYVTLEGDDAIYDFALPDLLEVVRVKVGDEVSFTYEGAKDGKGEDTASAVRTVTKFGDAKVQAGSDGKGDGADAQESTGDDAQAEAKADDSAKES